MDRIHGDFHIVDSNGHRKFRDSYVPTTIMSAEWLNSIQEEIVGVIEASNLFPSPSDNTQLVSAQRRRIRWAIDENTGAGNVYILNPSSTVDEYIEGLIVYFLPTKAASTSPVYTNVSGLGNIVIKSKGVNIDAGLLPVNVVARIVYVAGGWFEYIYPGSSAYG